MYHISYISEEIFNISNQMPCMCQRYMNYVSVSILYTLAFLPNEISPLISHFTDVKYKK